MHLTLLALRHRSIARDIFRRYSTLISVTLNGACRQFESPLTCAGLVAALGLTGKRVALERNGEIVPRSALDTHLLATGDSIEIVVAVGGG